MDAWSHGEQVVEKLQSYGKEQQRVYVIVHCDRCQCCTQEWPMPPGGLDQLAKQRRLQRQQQQLTQQQPQDAFAAEIKKTGDAFAQELGDMKVHVSDLETRVGGLEEHFQHLEKAFTEMESDSGSGNSSCTKSDKEQCVNSGTEQPAKPDKESGEEQFTKPDGEPDEEQNASLGQEQPEKPAKEPAGSPGLTVAEQSKFQQWWDLVRKYMAE